jgi:hypothetical protein
MKLYDIEAGSECDIFPKGEKLFIDCNKPKGSQSFLEINDSLFLDPMIKILGMYQLMV